MKSRKKQILSLAVLFLLNFFLIFLVHGLPTADAAVYRQGSSGDTVRQIQQRLKNWGYYTGAVDGSYGPKTVEAVKYFQRKNGLVVDGVCGTRTLQAIGITDTSPSAVQVANRDNDLELLARIISAEARGEPYAGQVAVGGVVLNRVKHPSFPNTLSGVIYQKGAFTCLTDGQFSQPVADSARSAARDALNGVDTSGGAIYYYNPATATSAWIWSRPILKKIGHHNFCA